MTRRLSSLLVTALLAAAGAVSWTAPAGAITGGSADGGHHPYVVAIIRAGQSSPNCSGVWTSVNYHRWLVVTDAHCVSPTRGAAIRVFFGSTWTSGAPTYAGRSYRHPQYDATTAANDVATIVLSHAPALRPAVLAPVGSSTAQSQVTTVGYGGPYWGERRYASEVVSSHSSWRLYLRPGSGNSCGGDSGGPDLIPGTQRIVALTDMGSCSWDEDTRLDTPAMRYFLAHS